MKKFLLLGLVLLVGSSLQYDEFLGEDLNELNATRLAERYKPILIFDEDESYYPLAIEDLNIDWSKADLQNATSFVTYNYTDPERLNRSAPIYASLLQNKTDNTIRISYAFLYSFNDCGPYMKISLDTNFGFEMNPEFNICPFGKHNGDIERITITVQDGGDYKILSLEYANHDSSTVLPPSDIIFRERRPYVYVAKGSHASYHKKGVFTVMNGWNKTGHTFSTSGRIVEKINYDGAKWSEARLRLLKLNGEPTSKISREETYLAFLFKGRLGGPIVNNAYTYFEMEMKAYAQSLNALSPQASQLALNAIYALSQQIFKDATSTLANPSRTWW